MLDTVLSTVVVIVVDDDDDDEDNIMKTSVDVLPSCDKNTECLFVLALLMIDFYSQ